MIVKVKGGYYFMSEENICTNVDLSNIKEAVCIDAYRVYDSCSDKDCLRDLKVYFCQEAQDLIDCATNVRLKDVNVINVLIDLEAVPFHKGFYSVNMTYFFEVELEVYAAPKSVATVVKGLSIFDKKVILYGSEGNVKVFSSDYVKSDTDIQSLPSGNLPKATVQVAKPIALSAKIDKKCGECMPCCPIPEHICRHFGSEMPCKKRDRDILVTIGIFTIVRIERNVQILVPSYDFCVPEKECITSSDNPCEMFSRLEFPTDEFFPPKVTDSCDDDFNCGCKN